MLSLFPSLLVWDQLSPFLIRIALGVVYIYWAMLRLKNTGGSANSKLVGILDAVLGIALIIGLWTQAAAAIIALDLVWRIVKKATERALFTSGVNYYVLLLVLAVSLLVTGAGWWAFDLVL